MVVSAAAEPTRAAAAQRKYDQTFSLSGALYISRSSKWYLPNTGGLLTDIVVSLVQAGTTPTYISMRINNELVTGGDIIMDPGVSYRSLPRTINVTGSDFITVSCTSAGEGAEGLSVQLRFVMN